MPNSGLIVEGKLDGVKGREEAVSGLRTIQAPAARRDRLAPVPSSSLERGALICPGFTSPEDARL